MADLVEKQIRDALVAALTGLTTTTTNVFSYREYPMQDAGLPGLAIYTDEEEIEFETMGSARKKFHQLEVRIEVFAKQTETVEDTIALIYKEVITALEADPTLGGLVKDFMNTANNKNIEEDGEKPAIGGIMTWIAQFRTVEGAPDVSVK